MRLPPYEVVGVLDGAQRHRVERVRLADGTEAIAKHGGPGALFDEAERMRWLDGRWRTPRLLGYARGDVLLVERLPGHDLARVAQKLGPERVSALLVEALTLFGSIEAATCPFGQGPRVVHGDACLPNLLTDGESITGIIDVADLRRGHLEDDVSAMLWSLGYNHLPQAREPLMRALGLPDDAASIDALVLRFER